MKVKACSRVAFAVGEKVVLDVPVVIPQRTIHPTASVKYCPAGTSAKLGGGSSGVPTAFQRNVAI
jgi:hypothetical protein